MSSMTAWCRILGEPSLTSSPRGEALADDSRLSSSRLYAFHDGRLVVHRTPPVFRPPETRSPWDGSGSRATPCFSGEQRPNRLSGSLFRRPPLKTLTTMPCPSIHSSG